jgi:HSP20 family protein
VTKRRDIDRMSELEELFADLWQVPRFAAGLLRAHRPQVDCFRTDDPAEVTVVIELPGADPDSIQVVLDGRRLIVAGERQRLDSRGGRVWYRSEIEYGPFERGLVLNEDVDVDAAAASYERGLLRIVLPVAAKPAKQERVPIKVRQRR